MYLYYLEVAPMNDQPPEQGEPSMLFLVIALLGLLLVAYVCGLWLPTGG